MSSGRYNIEEYKPRWIRIFRNGDPFYTGNRFPITAKRYKSFEYLLSDITERLDPPFGAVRNLFTPENGTRIRHLNQLKDCHCYVAGGAEKFRHVKQG